MPSSLWSYFSELREQADAIKLVGYARTPADNLPVLDLLNRADKPVIGLAMGRAGQLTRLIAPCYKQCLLSYGAASEEHVTAPGQLPVADLKELYRLDAAGPGTAVHLHLCASDDSFRAVIAENAHETPGRILHIAVRVLPLEAQELIAGLMDCVPLLTLTADPELGGCELAGSRIPGELFATDEHR